MFFTKKKYLVPSLFLNILLVITFFNVKKKSNKTVKETQGYIDDISCHVKTEGDALPSAEDASFSPPADSIFFHETSCRGGLTSRQACAVESAARAHPNRTVYVLFSGPILTHSLSSARNSLTVLKRYPNIEFARVHAQAYTKRTAFKHFEFGLELNFSHWKVIHASDMLRFVTMFKFGGIYLDTDVIVLKPLDALGRNWVSREDGVNINTAVMSVARDEVGRKVMRNVLEEIDGTYHPTSWSYNGPQALARVLNRFCSMTSVTYSKAICQGFRIYGPALLYPVPYGYHKVLFEPGAFRLRAYTVHIWSQLSQNLKVQFDSPIKRMALRHCPIIHELYEESFGLNPRTANAFTHF